MYTEKSEKRLAFLLLQILQCEKSVESSRQELCQSCNFDPKSAFHMIQNESTGKISPIELKLFLSKRSIAITPQYLELLISQYDSNADNLLSFEEFQAFVLPSEDYSLRSETLKRSVRLPSLYVQSVLARHIELESDWQRELQTYKRRLFVRYDFSPIDTFRLLDVNKENFLDGHVIKRFLMKFEPKMTLRDAERIIRRIDLDGDMRVGYEELLAAIMPIDRAVAEIRSPRVSKQKKIQSRKGSRTCIGSPKKSSPMRPSTRATFSSSVAKSELFKPELSEEVKEVLGIFAIQVGIDKDIEIAKTFLAKHADFNLGDLFRMVDCREKQFITCADIEKLLIELQIPYHVDEIYLLIKHLTINPERKISYREFQALFIPKNEEIYMKLQIRPARNIPDRFRAFSAETLNDIIMLLKLHLRSENYTESLRRKISQTPWISLFRVFHSFDCDKDGVIGLDDLAEVFEAGHLKLLGDDGRYCIERYSKGTRSVISYSDFVQELTPRII